MLRAAVISYLVVYVLVSLVHPPWKRRVRRFAVVIVVGSGGWRDLIPDGNTIPMLAGGAVIGILAFGVGVVLSRIGTGGVLAGLGSATGIGSFVAANPKPGVRCVLSAAAEELVWRSSIQTALGNTPTALVVTAVCFTLVHVVPKREEAVLAPYLDLLMFSVVLGLAYIGWESFPLVFAAHAVRNLGVRNLILEGRPRRSAGRASAD